MSAAAQRRLGRRLITASILLAAVGVTLGIGPAPALTAAAGTPQQLLPNLRSLPPSNVYLQERQGDRALLRFGNEIANAGPGVVELKPKQEDCDGDGEIVDDRTAIQRVYLDVDGDGRFDPDIDTQRTRYVVGCFRFHRPHAHWHFTNFARYELETLPEHESVGASRKVGFCLVDTRRMPDAPKGSPAERAYESCAPDAVQGLSVGWIDIYGPSLPGQVIDVTGVPDGDYCLRTLVDPGGVIHEGRDGDNGNSVAVTIARGSADAGLPGC